MNSAREASDFKHRTLRISPETELRSASELVENPKHDINRRNAFRKQNLSVV